MEKKLILASSSPRRKEILKQMGLIFEIVPSDYEEVLENFDFSYRKIEQLAYYKAKDVLDKLKSSSINNNVFVISADTVVVLNEQILGKPKDKLDAINMLRQLSGKKHYVVTSICVINSKTNENKIQSETSFVEFEDLDDDLILNYIEQYNPFDKAGSYGIQELPSGFIKNIEGSFENIVGLCPKATEKILNSFKL